MSQNTSLSGIVLSTQQAEAARLILQTWRLWQRTLYRQNDPNSISNNPYFFLAGYAGTGKTSCIKHILTHEDYLNLEIPGVNAFRQTEKRYRTQTEVPKDPPPSYEIAFGAFTAKACQVMQSKSIPGTTIHSMLYFPNGKDQDTIDLCKHLLINPSVNIPKLADKLTENDGEDHPYRKLMMQYLVDPMASIRTIQEMLDTASQIGFQFVPADHPRSRLRNTKLLVLDECSMIGDDIWSDLLRTGIPMIIIGDIGQLQPVKSQMAPFMAKPPHYMLTEIQRQRATQSVHPIIQFATMARNTDMIAFQNLKLETDPKQRAARIAVATFMKTDGYRFIGPQHFDQIICATHKRRKELNVHARKAHHEHTNLLESLFRDHGPMSDPNNLPFHPIRNDKVICGANNHELQLYNGVIYNVLEVDPEHLEAALASHDPQSDHFRMHRNPKFNRHEPVSAENPEEVPLLKPFKIKLAVPDPILTDQQGRPLVTETWATMPQGPFLPSTMPSNDFTFDFGYAITVHKSQGSEWPRVLVWNERIHRDQTVEDYAKWLYTAITRASHTVVLVG